MSSYPEDVRLFRRTKVESTADWLIWRKGKFSLNELESIKRGLNLWVEEQNLEKSLSRDEVLESLKWARENKVTAWCDIATRCSLPDRKIGSIRHCILRRYMPGCEVARWTPEQTAEFVQLQSEFGPRAWKKISQETGRSMEAVVNKGRQMNQVKKSTKVGFSKRDSLYFKLAKFDDENANPYEFNAIRTDCMLVSLIRRYHPNLLESVHEIPGRKIARKLGSTCDAVRLRWHQAILPAILKRVSSEYMDEYLISQLVKACSGKLNNSAFPACDWNSIDFRALMPLWSQTSTQNRLKQILRRQPKFDLVPLEQLAAMAAAQATTDPHTVNSAANAHFAEIRRIITLIADRGDEYFIK